MKVLITGGAGFLGSNIADHLIAGKNHVVVVDNFATGSRENVTPGPNLTLVEGDIADEGLVNGLFDEFGPDHVIHAAAAYKDPENLSEDINANIEGTINIVRASLRQQVKRIIYLQTALCYGQPKEHPVTLSHPLSPFTSYSISKTAGENYIIMSSLPYVSLRLANIYGPRNLTGPLPTFYQRLKAGKPCFVVDTKRDFFEVGDFIRLIDRILADQVTTGCFNVSTGSDRSIQEIFDLLVKAMGITLDTPVEVRPSDDDDVATLLLDPSETERAFGWKAETSLEEGIEHLVRWYDTHEVNETFTHLKIGKKN
ncbi:NAD-dependent epimerase/dehydratase family protein [Candidatus Latescibacterota bacterium]